MRTEIERSLMTIEAGDRGLWETVQDLDLPLALTDLSDFTVVAATQALFAQVGIPQSEILGSKVFQLFEREDRPRAQEALQALADGTIDFYRTHRRLARESSTSSEVSIWVHAIDSGPRHYALSEIVRSKDLQISPLVNYLGYTLGKIAIGIIDASGIITSVSSNVESVLGVSADNLIGHSLLQKSDREFWERLHEGLPERGPCLISLPLRQFQPSRQTGQVTCLLACLAPSHTYCFMVIRAEEEPRKRRVDRSAELEQRLWRIAQEVKASGVLTGMQIAPDLERFPQLGSLSTRQWEVLTRLLRGERVNTIASDLFISQSTVRNNLSTIFAKFGVHSQAELLNLLHQ